MRKPKTTPEDKAQIDALFNDGGTDLLAEESKNGYDSVDEEIQGDLFNEIPGQVGLFEIPGKSLEKIKFPGGLRPKQKVQGQRIPGVDLSERELVIHTSEDAASLLSHLVIEPQELVYLLSIDKDGKVLEVLNISPEQKAHAYRRRLHRSFQIL